MGNIVNRVFDSSGPEGKVRGTPQQIIEKYQFLARDAQLSNDRVAYENFLQHSEHYTRMLGEANREMQREADQRRDQPDGQGQQNRQPREFDQSQPGYRDEADFEAEPDPYGDQPRSYAASSENGNGFQTSNNPAPQPRPAQPPAPRQNVNPQPQAGNQPPSQNRHKPRPIVSSMMPDLTGGGLETVDAVEDDSGLVETPEMRPELKHAPKPAPRRRPAPRKAESDAPEATGPAPDPSDKAAE